MVEIPDSLRSVFSATIDEREGTYTIELPSREITHEALTPGETYRIAIFEAPTTAKQADQQSSRTDRTQSERRQGPPQPPVEEGEIREVTIETIGDQGDGIAKVERGYVVIVPETQPGEQPIVEIEQVRQNVAFASIVDPDSRTR